MGGRAVAPAADLLDDDGRLTCKTTANKVEANIPARHVGLDAFRSHVATQPGDGESIPPKESENRENIAARAAG